MAASEDLINFDIIETQKENIQSLPQGRSAKALASAFGATSFSPIPTPGSTRNLNDAIRAEYEKELQAIGDSDDPLDIYERYVKWTLNAYPTAQATPESQLRTLLERATKAFQSYANYKNDPRYLKLWMHYIRLFSDAPRETFAYLSRHGIGEHLALFYEEFAAWLEGVGRWLQAEEVYKLGIEREARPTERLLRKFGEFQTRFDARSIDADEPSSPALPTVRPALAAKLDPFASTTPRATDPQSQRLPSTSTSRSGKPKLAIFSDAEAQPSIPRPGSEDAAKGWDNIGSISERRKENTIEARPWVGETLKAGKKAGAVAKMAVFKDESPAPCEVPSIHQRSTKNAKTGRTEHVIVNLEAIYPDPTNPSDEYCFEELRAKYRGWLQKQWVRQPQPAPAVTRVSEDLTEQLDSHDMTHDFTTGDFTTSDFTLGGTKKPRKDRSRPRRKKVMEVKGETQTVKINLDSPGPAGRKVKRKSMAEPTMTLHTKAANEEMLDIFNAPLGHVPALGAEAESGDESEYDTDDYTSGGDSTGTGRFSAPASEYGEDEASVQSQQSAQTGVAESTEPKSVSEWSEFTKSKHIPTLQSDDSKDTQEHTQADFHTGLESIDESSKNEEFDEPFEHVDPTPEYASGGEHFMGDVPGEFPEETEELDFIAPGFSPQKPATVAPAPAPRRAPLSIPLPPEDYQHNPINPYRDPILVAQSRLPFMTPIVERTECSFPSIKGEASFFSAKTPSRRRNEPDSALPQIDDLLLSSPFQEIVNEARPERLYARYETEEDELVAPSHPVIQDQQCNPLDQSVRQVILDSAQSMLDSLPVYHDHRPMQLGKGGELRKFSRIYKSLKPGDKAPIDYPSLAFPHEATIYTMRRELGKGAFAPVYLATSASSLSSSSSSATEDTVAIKAEEPPSPWEFYIMTIAHQRLEGLRSSASLARPLGMHVFSDAGYLLESYHDQGTLLDLSNLSKADAAATGGQGLVDECVAMFFAAELLRTMAALHSVSILHGDLKADNCLVRLEGLADGDWISAYSADGADGWSSKGITLIDFGRALDRRNFLPTAQFIADWAPTKWDCPAVRAARPWTVQADYWGAAGVIHLLLFGKWMEDVEESVAPTSRVEPEPCGEPFVVLDDAAVSGPALDARPASCAARKFRLREGLKRYWQTDLWSALFELLLNPPVDAAASGDGRAEAGLRGLVQDLETYLEANAEKRGLKGRLRSIEEKIRLERRKRL